MGELSRPTTFVWRAEGTPPAPGNFRQSRQWRAARFGAVAKPSPIQE